jgi:hypothetical protein
MNFRTIIFPGGGGGRDVFDHTNLNDGKERERTTAIVEQVG